MTNDPTVKAELARRLVQVQQDKARSQEADQDLYVIFLQGKEAALQELIDHTATAPAAGTDLLPENPTQFDYLHAIRAVASRAGSTPAIGQIFALATEAMNLPDGKIPTP